MFLKLFTDWFWVSQTNIQTNINTCSKKMGESNLYKAQFPSAANTWGLCYICAQWQTSNKSLRGNTSQEKTLTWNKSTRLLCWLWKGDVYGPDINPKLFCPLPFESIMGNLLSSGSSLWVERIGREMKDPLLLSSKEVNL